jgi:hypothetical protein
LLGGPKATAQKYSHQASDENERDTDNDWH